MNASDLNDGEKKSIDFAGGKVLVSKIKGQVYATSAFCTHYGAPLEKGVLSHDGRIVCPWHGGMSAPAPTAPSSLKGLG